MREAVVHLIAALASLLATATTVLTAWLFWAYMRDPRPLFWLLAIVPMIAAWTALWAWHRGKHLVAAGMFLVSSVYWVWAMLLPPLLLCWMLAVISLFRAVLGQRIRRSARRAVLAR